MAKTKYPINREFFPYNHFTPPVNRRLVALAKKYMRPPRFLWHDAQLDVRSERISGYRDGEFELLFLTPKDLPAPAPCFIDIHGGGFIFDAAPNHYRHAVSYAKEGRCKVVFVRYRLAPEHPFPSPQEECYAAFCWVAEHAADLGVDPERIGIGGDSAGGTLAATTCLMARDRGNKIRPLFQLLIYPWLDGRNNSDSYHRYTDTPMWNSSMSRRSGSLTNPHPEDMPLAYRSPAEAESHSDLPPAYIEQAEFDSLHDDAALYAELLRREGIEVEFHETKGTMHGFDTKVDAPTTRKMVAARTAFLRRMFGV